MAGSYFNLIKLNLGISLRFELFKKTLAIVLFFLTFNLKAQTSVKVPTEIKAVSNSATGKLDVEFKNDIEVNNLLVIVTDSLGNTIFLENLYRFNGPYKKSIELTDKGKGSFTLHIIKDEERINRKLSLK